MKFWRKSVIQGSLASPALYTCSTFYCLLHRVCLFIDRKSLEWRFYSSAHVRLSMFLLSCHSAPPPPTPHMPELGDRQTGQLNHISLNVKAYPFILFSSVTEVWASYCVKRRKCQKVHWSLQILTHCFLAPLHFTFYPLFPPRSIRVVSAWAQIAQTTPLKCKMVSRWIRLAFFHACLPPITASTVPPELTISTNRLLSHQSDLKMPGKCIQTLTYTHRLIHMCLSFTLWPVYWSEFIWEYQVLKKKINRYKASEKYISLSLYIYFSPRLSFPLFFLFYATF